MSPRDKQRHEREGGLGIAQQRGKQVPFEMVHSKHGLAEREAQRRGDARADQECAGKSGALRVGDPIDIADRHARFGNDLLSERHHPADVISRRELRDDAAVLAVHRDLRMQRAREQTALAVIDGSAGFVA